jgi:transcriptional activator SPT8
MFGSPSQRTPRLLTTLRNPASSGAVVCLAAFPASRHLVWYISYLSISFLACIDKTLSYLSASQDNIRLWNIADAISQESSNRSRQSVQFKIIAGHHGGTISQIRESNTADESRTAS